MSVIKTHRGFILASSSSHGTGGYIDLPAVDDLYKRVETGDNFELDFDFINKVVVAAKQVLFTSEGEFVLLKQLKEKSSNWVLKFSISSLKFINGEQRQISLENFRDLMTFHPKDQSSIEYGQVIRENDFGWMFKATPGEIIAAWLGREDGLTDLVMSLQLIAGALPDGWHDQSDAA